jgi:Protein of unknown function (DUF4199)
MEAAVTKSNNIRNGLTFGVIIGLIYCVSLFLRYNMISSGVIMVGLITILFYLGVIGMLFYCGIKRRNELGGYIDLKNAFQTIFVAILIAELIYTIFNFIYLKFIDPGYFDKMKTTMEAFMERTIKDDDRREEALDKFRERFDKQKTWSLTLKGIVLGYLMWVAITGVFGFIAALIIRKNKPVFELDNQS